MQQIHNPGDKVPTPHHQLHGLDLHRGLLSWQGHVLWSEGHLHLAALLHGHHIGQQRADALQPIPTNTATFVQLFQQTCATQSSLAGSVILAWQAMKLVAALNQSSEVGGRRQTKQDKGAGGGRGEKAKGGKEEGGKRGRGRKRKEDE